MNFFDQPVSELAYYEDIRNCIKKIGKVPVIHGLVDQQKAHFIHGISGDFAQRLIITHNEVRAREIYEDYRALDENTWLYPAKDFVFFSANIHGNQLVRERLEIIEKLVRGESITVVTTIDGCMDRLIPAERFEKHMIHLDSDSELDADKFTTSLVELGYVRTAGVENPGEFSVRGGIIDVYPIGQDVPVRIELWGDEIDSMRIFDASTQRTIDNVSEVDIFSAVELILDEEAKAGIRKIEQETVKYSKTLEDSGKILEAARIRKNLEELKEKIFVLEDNNGLDNYISYLYPKTVSFMDYFSLDSGIVFLDEPNRIQEKIKVVNKEFSESMSHRLEKGYILPGQANVLFEAGEIYSKAAGHRLAAISAFDCKMNEFSVAGHYNINAKSIGAYNNSFETLVTDIVAWKKKNYRILLVSASRTRAKRLAENLMDNDVFAVYSEDVNRVIQPKEIVTAYGKLKKGYEYPDLRFVVIAEDDIFGAARKEHKKRKRYEGKSVASFNELNVGDYVIHENHGLGIYRGIEKLEVDKVEKDYIKIEYAKGGNLYILATQLDMLQKYADSEAKKPKLNSLGSVEWAKTKTKVRNAVHQVADELVRLYAIRQQKEGYAFEPDTVWQREFEELFPYEETKDQLMAIEDTKKDMESHKIMDRLICGDVGFGKTEIALRAAFKAAHNDKQVVYLVPTTILAKQHFSAFDQRMKDFSVNVRMLSRFSTPKEIKETLNGLKNGNVDIVVGTHRVLSKDVVFKDLGLLIIDEEQRFGVSHKEKIKQLKESVDVLTLTATPIPRTLHMSLIGIRDMSVLEEPPVDRLPIQTFVTEYDEEMVREAVNRELARGGQVYYVFNRVQGIEDITLMISKLVPDANVAFAHGQMHERELEKIMVDFVNGDIDVLVSTTIIETGLDIPNVNTIIIHDSDKFGLSQLYQLRGRVGRSGRVAYAFLMYKKDKMLKEVAEKRLSAIREFTELGSGFKIAMKDLEIRGAGNLLGEEQHGHMEAVGYDLYCKMLNEAVLDVKGEKVMEDFETVVDIDVDAFVPAQYIHNETQKLDIYKRIAGISSEEELSDMQDELMDRFGDIPKQALNLMQIALIKSRAHMGYILEIRATKKDMCIKMNKSAKIDPAGIPPLIAQKRSKMRFTSGDIPYFTYYFGKEEIANTDKFLNCIRGVVEEILSLRCE